MRNAFTMIELIISIVVIGIAIMTLPIVLEQSAKTNEIANLARFYFNAQVLLQKISMLSWDKQVAIKAANNEGSLFVDTTNGDKSLDRLNGTTKRIGSFETSDEMRHFYEQKTLASTITNNATNYNAIEDYSGYQTSIDNTNFNVSVAYVNDGASNNSPHETATWHLNGGATSLSNSTNLKRITVTITQPNGTSVNLAYFSSNIGAQITQLK